jgi:hypothetical protein
MGETKITYFKLLLVSSLTELSKAKISEALGT